MYLVSERQEQVKFTYVHLVSRNTEKATIRYVHQVFRTTQQDKQMNGNHVSRNNKQGKYTYVDVCILYLGPLNRVSTKCTYGIYNKARAK